MHDICMQSKGGYAAFGSDTINYFVPQVHAVLIYDWCEMQKR